MTLFDYENKDAIGTVYSVDTGTILVTVSDDEQLRIVQVNHLVALRSSKAGQHLIGLINKITRKTLAEAIEPKSNTQKTGPFSNYHGPVG